MIAAADRTHCVTFQCDGDKYFAVKSRNYGDPEPTGVKEPSIACAMPEEHARRMAAFLRKESINFTNIRIQKLNIKPNN